MKNYILGTVMFLAILVTPTLVQAQAAGLNSSQISAIIQLLQAFGASQSIINSVQIALNGGTNSNTPTPAQSTPATAPAKIFSATVPQPTVVAGYGSVISGAPCTLTAYAQTISPTGTVAVNGIDTAQPTAPFNFSWGDGNSTSGFFPQSHAYQDVNRNYVITITATENAGSSQQFSFPVFLTAPSVTPQALPGVSFQIPSQPAQFGSNLPSGETVFSDSSLAPYSRSSMEYILGRAAAISKDFANDNVRLSNGVFAIDMLQNASFGGGSFQCTQCPFLGYYCASDNNARIVFLLPGSRKDKVWQYPFCKSNDGAFCYRLFFRDSRACGEYGRCFGV